MSELEAKMRDLLAEASVLADASSSKFEPRTSKGKSESKPPIKFGASIHDTIQRGFRDAESAAERQEAIRWAEGLIQSFKRQKPREMGTTEKEFWKKRKILDGTGKHYMDLAHELGLSEKYIWKIRSANELEPRYGRPKEKKDDEAA